MPYPQNLQTALEVEEVVRQHGAVPATIAIVAGRPCVGLSREQLEHIAQRGTAVHKVSRRDLPMVLAKGLDGATTVSATMLLAARAGIRVFVTGGIGGVHRCVCVCVSSKCVCVCA
jgi:pseudouridine-5'-phosphate glycosidase